MAAPLAGVSAMAFLPSGELLVLDATNDVLVSFGAQQFQVIADASRFRPASFLADPLYGTTHIGPMTIDGEGHIYLVVKRSRRISAKSFFVDVESTVYRLGDDTPLFSIARDEIESLTVSSDGLLVFSIGRDLKQFKDGQVTAFPPYSVNSKRDSANRSALDRLEHLAFDVDGSLYFTEGYPTLVRVARRDGTLSTLAGGGTERTLTPRTQPTTLELDEVSAVAVDRSGHVFIADKRRGLVLNVAPAGSVSIHARLKSIGALAINQEGQVFAASSDLPAGQQGNKVFRLSATGTIGFAGNGRFKYSGNGGDAKTASLNNPRAAAVAPDGTVYIADAGNSAVRRVDLDEHISTWAPGSKEYRVPNSLFPRPFILPGKDGVPTVFRAEETIAPGVQRTCGLTVDSSGVVYVASIDRIEFLEQELVVRKIGADGSIAVVARFKGETRYCALVPDRTGGILIASPRQGRVYRLANGALTPIAGSGIRSDVLGDGGPAGFASLAEPSGVTIARNGTVYVADSQNHRIRKITKNTIETIAGNGQPEGDAGSADAKEQSIRYPLSLAADSAGAVYFVNGGPKIRRIETSGVISTVVDAEKDEADLPVEANFVGLAMEPSGNLLVVDAGRDIVYRLILAGVPAARRSNTVNAAGGQRPPTGRGQTPPKKRNP